MDAAVPGNGGARVFVGVRARARVYVCVCTPSGGGVVCCCLRVYRTFYTKSGLGACWPAVGLRVGHYYTQHSRPSIRAPPASVGCPPLTPASALHKDALVRDHLDKHWLLNVPLGFMLYT